ncbi:MAG: hypothetical protein EXS58_16020 [Candidatus Latescibacteria bacterium]|nr:hypothetical protein [Candidatus Latescibacterota bacterium]
MRASRWRSTRQIKCKATWSTTQYRAAAGPPRWGAGRTGLRHPAVVAGPAGGGIAARGSLSQPAPGSPRCPPLPAIGLQGGHPVPAQCRAHGPDHQLAALHGKGTPELDRRWQGAQSLGIKTDLGSCVLQAQRGHLRLGQEPFRSGLRLGQETLLQLLMGYYTPGELLAAGRLQAPRPCHALLERLFPLTQAHMWWPDRF